jgi:hypothetical protein
MISPIDLGQALPDTQLFSKMATLMQIKNESILYQNAHLLGSLVQISINMQNATSAKRH